MSLSPPGHAPGSKISICPRCGATLPMEGRFCGNCGHVLGEAVPGAAPQAPTSPAAAPQPAPMAPAPQPASAPAPRAQMRTMMGLAPGAGAPVAPPAPTAPPATAVPSAPVHVGAAHKTMMGLVAAAPPPPGGIPGVVPAPSAPALPNVANAHKTMMGVVAPLAPPSAVGAPSAPAPQSQPIGAVGGPLAVANAQATMLGVESPLRTRSERPPMMGGAAPGVPPDTLPPGIHHAPAAMSPYGGSSSTDDAIAAVLPGRRSRGGMWIAVGVVLLAGAALLAFSLRGRGSRALAPVQAELASSDTGTLSVVVTFPDAPAGTRVRYGNQAVALDAQHRATFTLNDLGERVGPIDLPLDVESNGTHEQRTARIVLGYRVEPDLTGLASDPPTLRLMFRVVPGSHLTIEGQNVVTDQHGAAVATMDSSAPMPVDGPPTREERLHVRVTAPDGTVTAGTYVLRVPRTPLLVERPLAAMVTTSTQIVVRGHAPGARRATVNGRAVELRGDLIETTLPVALGHQAIDVRAYAATAGPASAHLDVERVNPNDRQAAIRFVGTSPAGVADVAAGSLQPGRRIRLQGRVLSPAREYDGGQTFQLVVNDRACGPTPCLVWVDTEPGTAPAVNANIEVDGTVTGRRQWVTTTNERRTDSVIMASFIF